MMRTGGAEGGAAPAQRASQTGSPWADSQRGASPISQIWLGEPRIFDVAQAQAAQ